MAPSPSIGLMARSISSGGIAGAVVGCVVGVIVILLLCLPFVIRARRERRNREHMAAGYPPPMGQMGHPMGPGPMGPMGMGGPTRSLGGPMPVHPQQQQPPYMQHPPNGMPSPPPNPDDSNSFDEGKFTPGSQMPRGPTMGPYAGPPPANGNTAPYQYPSPPPTTNGPPMNGQTTARSAPSPGGPMVNAGPAPFNPDQPATAYPSPPPTLPHTDTMRTRSSVRSSGASSVSHAIEGITSFFRSSTRSSLNRPNGAGTRGAMEANTRSPAEMGYPQYDNNGNQMWMMTETGPVATGHPGYPGYGPGPVGYQQPMHPMQSMHPMQPMPTMHPMQDMQPGQPGQLVQPHKPAPDAHLVDPTFEDGQYLTGASAEYYSGAPMSPPTETTAGPSSPGVTEVAIAPTPPDETQESDLPPGSSAGTPAAGSRGMMQPKLITSRTDSLKTATGTDFSPLSPTSPPRGGLTFEPGRTIVDEPEEEVSDEDEIGDRTLSLSPEPVTSTTRAQGTASLTPEPQQDFTRSPSSTRLVPSPRLPAPGTVNPRDVWAPGTEDERFVHKTAELDRIEHSPPPATQFAQVKQEPQSPEAGVKRESEDGAATPTPSEHGGDAASSNLDGRQSAMSFLSPSVVSVSSYVTASAGQDIGLDDYDDFSENDIDYGQEMMAGTQHLANNNNNNNLSNNNIAVQQTTADYTTTQYTTAPAADYSPVDYKNAGLNVYQPQEAVALPEQFAPGPMLQPLPQTLPQQMPQQLHQAQPQFPTHQQQAYSLSVSPPDPKIDEMPIISSQYGGQQYNGPLFWVGPEGNQMVANPYAAPPPQQNFPNNLLATPAMTSSTATGTQSPSPGRPSSPYSNHGQGATLSDGRPASSNSHRTPTPQPMPGFLPVTPIPQKHASNFNSPLSVPATGSQGPVSPVSNGGSTPGHSNASASPRIFTCDECGRVFDQIHKLNHHKRYHERPHECPVPDCGKRFGTKTHLDRHINDKHSKSRKYHCTEEGCPYSVPGGKSFPRKDNWRRHMVNKHNVHPDHEPIEVVDQPMGGF